MPYIYDVTFFFVSAVTSKQNRGAAAMTTRGTTRAAGLGRDSHMATRVPNKPKRIVQPNRRFVGPNWTR